MKLFKLLRKGLRPAPKAAPTPKRKKLAAVPSATSEVAARCKAALKTKKPVEIRKACADLARNGSTHPDAWSSVSNLLARGHQWNAVISYFARCNPAWQESPEHLLLVGRAERHLHHTANSIGYLQKAATLDPSPESRIELGLAFLDAGRQEEALDQLRFIAADLNSLRSARIFLKRLSEMTPHATLAILQEVSGSHPDNPLAAISLGEFYLDTKGHSEAFAIFQGALKREPENSELGLRLMKSALAMTSDDHLLDAIQVGERFFFKSLSKEFASALAAAYVRYPSSGEAEEGLDRIFYAFNSDPRLLTILSEGYLRNGSIEKAEHAIRKAHELKPDDAGIIYRLAGVLAQQSRPDEAIATMLRHISSTQRDAAFYARVGHVRAWAGSYEAAISDLQSALAIDNQHPGALADIAHCYDVLGDLNVAFLAMQNALIASIIRPQPSIPGLAEMNHKRIRRRLMLLAHLTNNENYARSLYEDMRREDRLSMLYAIKTWQDDPTEGRKVMCIVESGIGDEIRYTASYRHKLANAKSVSVTCDPRMLSILSRSFPTFQFYPVQRTYPRLKKVRHDVRRRLVPKRMSAVVSDEVVDAGENVDLWMRAQDLYETTFFSKSRPAVPSSLIADPDLRRKFRETLDSKSNGRKVIGLSWRGGHHSYNRDSHYFDLRDWEPILDNEQYSFVNLQYALRDDELAYLRGKLGGRFIEFGDLDLMDDIEGIAALCSELDHVIGVCTAVLELAGAVGAPTLFMMRSPESSQSIRLTGTPDAQGTFSDSVWGHCRILPKRQLTDAEMVRLASLSIGDYLANQPTLDHAPSTVVKVLFPGNRGSGGSSVFDTAEIQN